MSAARWPYRRSPEWIAARLAAIEALTDAGRARDADGAVWELHRALGAGSDAAVRAVQAMPVYAGQACLFDAEVCGCCGVEPVGDRDGVRCGRCAGPRHRPRGGSCGAGGGVR